METSLLWLQLAGAAAIILASSTFLAKSADIIAFKTGLGRSFIGVVLLATATSLPELGTGVSSIALVDAPDLAAGDAFGSNLFNLLIVGLMDFFWREGPILTKVGRTSIVIGALGIALISLAGAALLIHGMTTTLSTWYISPISAVMFVVFLGAVYMIYRVDQTQEGNTEAQNQNQSQDHEYASASLSGAIWIFLAAASVIVASAIWLAQTGDEITEAMGWDASYVGTQFLAFSTSLPELAASFAALRLNAPELAITNILGSNLFNMGFVLFLDDVAYSRGALWAAVSEVHALTAVIAVLMTSVVILSLIGGPRRRPGKYWTVEAVVLVGLYVVASVLVYKLG